MSLIRKKYKRTKKPIEAYSLMFAGLGFLSQTSFTWANDNVLKSILNGSRDVELPS
nr:hypothetical protein [Pedobacter sp. ASV2]